MPLREGFDAAKIKQAPFDPPAPILGPDVETCRSVIDDAHAIEVFEASGDLVPQPSHDRGIERIEKKQQRGVRRKVFDGVAVAHRNIAPSCKASRAPSRKVAIYLQPIYRAAMACTQPVVQHPASAGADVDKHVLGTDQSAENLREQTVIRVQGAVSPPRALARRGSTASKPFAVTQIDENVARVAPQREQTGWQHDRCDFSLVRHGAPRRERGPPLARAGKDAPRAIASQPGPQRPDGLH